MIHTKQLVIAILLSLLVISALVASACGVKVTDTDGDGWSDEKETVVGTDPHNVDMDNDGYSDPKDGDPKDTKVPDSSEKTQETLMKNREIELAIGEWIDNDLFSILQDIGEEIRLPIAKDVVAKALETAAHSTIQYKIIEVEMPPTSQEYAVTTRLSIFPMLPKWPNKENELLPSLQRYEISIEYKLSIVGNKVVNEDVDIHSFQMIGQE